MKKKIPFILSCLSIVISCIVAVFVYQQVHLEVKNLGTQIAEIREYLEKEKFTQEQKNSSRAAEFERIERAFASVSQAQASMQQKWAEEDKADAASKAAEEAKQQEQKKAEEAKQQQSAGTGSSSNGTSSSGSQQSSQQTSSKPAGSSKTSGKKLSDFKPGELTFEEFNAAGFGGAGKYVAWCQGTQVASTPARKADHVWVIPGRG